MQERKGIQRNRDARRGRITGRTEEQGTFGSLSTIDVAMVAGAFELGRETLGPLLAQKGIPLVEPTVTKGVVRLLGKKGVPAVHEAQGDKKRGVIHQARKDAFGKAKELVEAPGFEEQWTEISAKDENVGLLLLHLSELNTVQVTVEGGKVVQGIGLLEEAMSNPLRRSFAEGSPLLQKEPKDTSEPTIVFKQTDLSRLETGENLTEAAPIDEPEKDKFHRILDRDPAARDWIQKYLLEIQEKFPRGKEIKFNAVNRAFSRLREREVRNALEHRLVRPSAAYRAGQPSFDAANIATLLYIHDRADSGVSFPRGLQKSIRPLAMEEHKKMIADKEEK
jgi:hypothetical protein